MIGALAGLLLCQLVGEVVVRALALPLPGPVAGLGLLFAFLVLRGRGRDPAEAVPFELGRVCDALLRHLSLLFIPAAVGVVQYLGLLRTFLAPLAVVIAVSTALTLVVTALVFALMTRWRAPRDGGPVAAEEPTATADPVPMRAE